MQTITVSLLKNPEIAEEVVDREPGDNIRLHGTIKALDEQTLTVTINEISIPEDENSDEDKEEPMTGNEGSGDVVTAPGDGLMLDEEDAAV